MNALVSISYEWTDGSTWRSQATGFLYGRLTEIKGAACYDVYLVSSQHCFQLDNGSMYSQVLVSFNPRNQSEPAMIAELPLCQGSTRLWTSIEGVDIAVLRMGLWELHHHDVDYVFLNNHYQQTAKAASFC